MSEDSGNDDIEELERKVDELRQKLQTAKHELKLASRPFDEATADYNSCVLPLASYDPVGQVAHGGAAIAFPEESLPA